MNEYTAGSAFSVRRERITWAVQRLILVNVAAFAIQLLADVPLGTVRRLDVPGGMLADILAFQPRALLLGCVWKPFSYIFLHADLMHLFMNMLWLFFFGVEVERLLGTRQFVVFFLFCGAAGVLATFVPWALTPGYNVSVVGASGAVMGVLIAFAMINPERQFFLFPLPIPVNARALVVIVIAMNVVSALSGGGNRSVATHFGGMIVGAAYMKAAPLFRAWRLERERQRYARKNPEDKLRDAVDNVFQFDDERRRRNR